MHIFAHAHDFGCDTAFVLADALLAAVLGASLAVIAIERIATTRIVDAGVVFAARIAVVAVGGNGGKHTLAAQAGIGRARVGVVAQLGDTSADASRARIADGAAIAVIARTGQGHVDAHARLATVIGAGIGVVAALNGAGFARSTDALVACRARASIVARF